MTQFDELFKALNNANPTPPKSLKPTTPGMAGFLFSAQNMPKKVTPGLAGFLNSAQPKPLIKFAPPVKPKFNPGFVRVIANPPKTVRIAKPKVFVSFDFENDGHYKLLLEAWNANTRFQFTFQDKTPQEIKSDAVDRVKAVLSTKVQDATHVLVIVGQYANQPHSDRLQIGSKNWINFEVKQAKFYKKKIVAVLLNGGRVTLPDELVGSGATGVIGFNQAPIIKALNEAQSYVE